MTMALMSRGYNVEFVPIEVDKRVGSSTVSFSTGLETLILLIRIVVLFDLAPNFHTCELRHRSLWSPVGHPLCHLGKRRERRLDVGDCDRFDSFRTGSGRGSDFSNAP